MKKYYIKLYYIMNFMKDLRKLKVENIILLVIAGLFLLYLFNNYNKNKNMGSENMSGRRNGLSSNGQPQSNAGVQPSQPLGQNEVFASASGVSTSSQGLPPSCSREPVADPSELLPKDTNSQWSELNPTGSGDLENVNLLRAGYHMGIDTIGNTLRNANLQVRSEPANPQVNVGPWNNTTISPDTSRTPLEIGQGPQ